MKNIRENQITISYDKITQEYITMYGQESLLVLAILSRSYTIRKEVVFSLKYLFDMLKVPLNKRDRRNSIIKCINRMLNCNIGYDTEVYKQLFIPYETPKSQYLIITDSEVDTILGYNKRIDKYSLFNTYVTIKRYVNHKTNTAFPSIGTIMDITNVVSNRTILRYIKILEELNMISCVRSDEYIIKDNEIRRPNNEYSILG